MFFVFPFVSRCVFCNNIFITIRPHFWLYHHLFILLLTSSPQHSQVFTGWLWNTKGSSVQKTGNAGYTHKRTHSSSLVIAVCVCVKTLAQKVEFLLSFHVEAHWIMRQKTRLRHLPSQSHSAYVFPVSQFYMQCVWLRAAFLQLQSTVCDHMIINVVSSSIPHHEL